MGSYLVTGYRGVGKTSVVKKVLHDYADGLHHLNLRERADLLGPFLMRLGNSLLRGCGWLLLGLHRSQARRIRKRRERGYAAPHFFWRVSILLSSISLANLRWVLIGAVLLILLFASPVGEIMGLIGWMPLIIGLVLTAALIQQFSKHRLAIFYPGNWWRWLFRPVIPIHINLGHEGLDPKKILFSLVHVLRGSYREPFRLFSLATLVRISLFAGLTLALTVVFYDLFRTANDYTEALLQDVFFSDFIVSGKQLKSWNLCRVDTGNGECADYYRMTRIRASGSGKTDSQSDNRIEFEFIPLLPTEKLSTDESLVDTPSVSGPKAMSIAKSLDRNDRKMNRSTATLRASPGR